MTVKTKRGLSYVLGDSDDNENHILPINAMQFSPITNNFYTGGRDGTIKTWSSGYDWQPLEQDTPSQFNFTDKFESGDFRESEVDQDIDERVLKLETSISSNPVPCSPTPYEDYRITDNYNIHFDWINDLKLVNNDRDLVSCSSDLSLKLINLHTSDRAEKYHIHKFPNVHTDYIKRLSYIIREDIIVSGGLDGKVVLWDLNRLKCIQEIQTHSLNPSLPNSIYSLASNNSNLISTGGPNNTINLYDRRLPNKSNSIKKLIGHQDNIRCLLMNDHFVLSGSSDTTIKLWDLRNFKVSKNFDIHEDAVWSMATPISSSPGILSRHEDSYNTDFKVFFSGDKGGTIVKTDLSYLSANVGKNNLPIFDTFTTSEDIIDDRLGLSTIVAKANSPIISLCCETDIKDNSLPKSATLLASTELSLNRYHIPDTDQLTKYQYLRTCLDYAINHENLANEDIALLDGAPEQNDLNSEFYDLVSHLSIDTNNFDLQSSFSGNNYPISNVDGTGTNEINDGKEYNSMFLCIDGGPSTEFINTYKEEVGREDANNPNAYSTLIDFTPVEILLNPIPHEQITPIPFNKKPFCKFSLVPKSIIAKRLFNNRRHMIVLYLNGDLKIWDIFACTEIRTFPYSSNSAELSKDLINERTKDMEDIFQKYQSPDTLNTWCEVDIKSGKLLVTLKETNFNNVEIYYDELCNNYPHLAYDHSDNVEGLKNSNVKVNHDDRFQLSRILLNSLFHQYTLYEWEFDKQVREELKSYKRDNRKVPITSTLDRFANYQNSALVSNNASISGTSSTDISSNNNTSKRIKMFTRKSSKNNIQENEAHGADNSTTSSINESYHTVNGNSTYMSDFISNSDILSMGEDEPRNHDSIMNLLQFNKRRYWEKYISFGINKTVDPILSIYSNDPKYSTDSEDNDVYKPLMYPQRLPGNLLIIIFEHSPDLGNLRDLCSFHFDDLLNLHDDSNTNQVLLNNLRTYLPIWIGKPILYNKFPTKELIKIEFLLMEYEYGQLPLETKIGGKSQKKIKKLPISEPIIQLSSHNMLRVLKILVFLTEKFDSKTPEMKANRPAVEWLSLECRGEQLPLDMTLQTIKSRIWKSNSEIELRFRRNFDT